MNEERRKAREYGRKGLTLIEGIVVLAVVTILAALLFPAAQHSRAMARQITCANNLKELGQAYTVCMTESNGQIPNAFYTFEEAEDGHDVTLVGAEASSANALLRYTDPGVLACPNDNTPESISAFSASGDIVTAPLSYAYNVGLPVLFRNVSRVDQPVNTVMFYDGHPDAISGKWNYSTNWARDTISYRHGGQANGVFVDGHVESYADLPQWAFKPPTVWLAFSIETESGHTIVGETDIEANPSFFLLVLANGDEINIDDLKDKHTEDFKGAATLWRIKPKGSSQALLLVDGDPYPLEKNTVYTITAETMAVHLWNDKRDKNGYAVGHWLIRILEAKNADIETN
jgi:prepilin-type processing-associated H-X9-DG protein/prepilin-type N-terminal cleavage/methylation domain-containing protein